MIKEINVNLNDVLSIEKAEKQKTKLENNGYNLVNSRLTGLNSVRFTYKK